MNSKKILFFLVLMLLYVNVYIPLSEKNIELKQNIASTKLSIAKDKLYISKQDKILLDINKSQKTNNIYIKNHFFHVKNTQVFNMMQKQIKKEIQDSNLTEDNINWGESYKGDIFIKFPISVRVYGSIKNIGIFFNSLQKNQKLHIKSFTMRKTKEFYIIEFSLYGLKRVKDV